VNGKVGKALLSTRPSFPSSSIYLRSELVYLGRSTESEQARLLELIPKNWLSVKIQSYRQNKWLTKNYKRSAGEKSRHFKN
tara:strand:- start:543 stop:785 length:243 start_codon:yes stop_codon:yes gene_type:complete